MSAEIFEIERRVEIMELIGGEFAEQLGELMNWVSFDLEKDELSELCEQLDETDPDIEIAPEGF